MADTIDSIGKTCIAIGVGLFALTIAVSGCQMGDIVKVDVPLSVRAVVPSAPRVSYNQGVELFDDWQAQVKRTGNNFQLELEKKAELVSLLSSFTSNSITAGIPVLQSIPGGGFLATGLLALGAWFTKSPGTSKLLAKEKEASFNKGMEKGTNAANASVRRASGEVEQS